MRSASTVTFSAYLLHPGPVEEALIAAAKRHARVRVALEGNPYRATPEMAADNRKAVRALQAAGADARLMRSAAGDGPAMHMKAAVCDRAAFLDDRNWNRTGDMVIRDDTPSHVRAIAAVLCGEKAAAGNLALDKDDAVRLEARAVANVGRGRVDVETETLGTSRVSGALRRLAKAGVHCRLLVSSRAVKEQWGRTAKEAASLQRDGVDVRVARSNEKFAIAAGRCAWVGSANATSPHDDGDCLDWGLSTRSPELIHALERRFNAYWKDAKPLTSETAVTPPAVDAA